MKRYATLTLAALMGVILDCVVFANRNLGGVRPWVLLAVALAACVEWNVQSGIVVACIGGLMIDALTNAYLGLTAACYLLSVSVLWLLIRKNHPKKILLALYGALVTALHAPIVWLYAYIGGAHAHGLRTLLTVALPSAVLTGLCMLPLLYLLAWGKRSHRDRI